MSCRVCGAETLEIYDFGFHPLGNGFSVAPQGSCFRFPLILDLCVTCSLYQLREQPNACDMFHSNYAFYSGTSQNMKNHFREVAEKLFRSLNLSDSSVVCEIGCNDGIFLANFVGKVQHCIGFEPSSNVGILAEQKGCNVIYDFFGSCMAESLEFKGSVDLIYGANVICHIPDFFDVLIGVAKLLSEKGVFVFEEPYIGDVFGCGSYDQLYDEHVFLFGVCGVSTVARKAGLRLVNVERVGTHGGSMRYYIANESYRESDSVLRYKFEEEWSAIYSVVGIERFQKLVTQSRKDLISILEQKNAQGSRVVSYGATSKSTTVFNFCGIDSTLISSAVDITPSKQGCFIPGTDIIVVPPSEEPLADSVSVFLGAWNHAYEIVAKERANGSACSWISHVPFVREFD